MGHAYHVAVFKKYKGKIDPVDNSDGIDLPEPLPMSKDEKKVNLLRKAFQHLGKLSFYDIPDYNLIKECLEGFLDADGEVEEASNLASIRWEHLHQSSNQKKIRKFPCAFETFFDNL